MSIYDYYDKLMKNLEIPDFNIIIKKIIQTNYPFYSEYFKIDCEGYKFNIIPYQDAIIYEFNEVNKASYSIRMNDLSENVILLFVLKNQYVYIESISYYQSDPKLELSKNCKDSLFPIVLSFIDTIKNKYDIKFIEMKDNYTYTFFKDIKIKKNNYYLAKPLLISNLKIFTKGKTWPEKYGFSSETISDYDTDIIAKNTQVKDYLIEVSKYIGEKFDSSFYKNNKNESISNFIKNLICEYNNGLLCFHLISDKLMEELKIDYLSDKIYHKQLN